MANWTIQRWDAQAGAASGLVCTEDGGPVAITLFDKDNNVTSTVNICFDTGHGNPCILLDALRSGGYTPADWDTECPALGITENDNAKDTANNNGES